MHLCLYTVLVVIVLILGCAGEDFPTVLSCSEEEITPTALYSRPSVGLITVSTICIPECFTPTVIESTAHNIWSSPPPVSAGAYSDICESVDMYTPWGSQEVSTLSALASTNIELLPTSTNMEPSQTITNIEPAPTNSYTVPPPTSTNIEPSPTITNIEPAPTTHSTEAATNTSEGKKVCYCRKPCPVVNSTDESRREFTAKVLKPLQMDKKSVSKERRRYQSVSDDRPSSTMIGGVGVVFFVLVFGSIVLMDAIGLAAYIYRCARKKAKRQKNVKVTKTKLRGEAATIELESFHSSDDA